MKGMLRTGAFVLAAALAAGALAACGDDDNVGLDESSGASADAVKALPPGEAFQGRSDTVAGSAPAAPANGGSQPALPSVSDRKIIFNATLGLEVPEVGRAFNEVGRIAQVNGGFIERSTFSGDDDNAKRTGASATVRVPGDRYQATLQDLRALAGAKVRSESSKSTDVTEQYTDLQSRLRNLERTEQQYLKLLEQAKGIPEILAMTDRIDAVRGQIEQVQGRLNVLDKLTELASIDVTLSPLAAVKAAPKDSGPKGIGQSFADSWAWSLNAARYLGAAGAALLVVAGWVAIPALLVLVALRQFKRRFPQLGRALPPAAPPPPSLPR